MTMKHFEKIAPAGALTAALLSLSCCVPLGITAAFGLAGISLFASTHQLWLIAASIGMLLLGMVQLLRRPVCQRRSRTSVVLLCVAAVLVVAVTFFPQSIASFLADRLP